MFDQTCFEVMMRHAASILEKDLALESDSVVSAYANWLLCVCV